MQVTRLSCVLLVALAACFKAAPDRSRAAEADQGVRHASCALPLPDPLPPSAGAYTALPELDCSHASPLGACSPQVSCTAVGSCITPDPNASGLCIDYAVCSQGAVPVGHQNGRCVTCMSPATRNALCCLHPEGVDCVGPPEKPTHKREIGELCHVHDDCAPGLLCKRRNGNGWGLGFGRCLCPELDPAYVEDSVDCSPFSVPIPWGENNAVSTVRCAAAPDDTFSVEVLSRQMDLLAGKLDHAGRLHILHRSYVDSGGFALSGGPSLADWVYENSKWSLVLLPVTGELTAVGFTFDEQDAMHALVARGAGELVYVTNAGGTWQSIIIPAGVEGKVVDTAVASTGELDTLHFAYLVAQGAPLHHLIFRIPKAGEAISFSDLIVEQADVKHLVALLAHGSQLTFMYLVGDTPNLAVSYDPDFAGTPIHDGKYASAALTSDGELAYTYELAGTIDMPIASQVRLARGPLDESVWTLDNLHYERALPYASLAFDSSDRPWVAHRAPAGIVLEEPVEQGFEQHVLASGRSEHILTLVDHKNAPHVFFLVQVAADGSFELRHAFSGPCPTPK